MTNRKKVFLWLAALALLFSLVLTDAVLGVRASAAEESPDASFTSQEESVTFDNETGTIRLTDSSIKNLYITGDQNADNVLVLIIAEGSSVDTVYVDTGVFVFVAKGATVKNVVVRQPVDSYVGGEVENVTLADGAFLQVYGTVDKLNVGASSFVEVKANAAVREMTVEGDNNTSVINVEQGASIESVNVDGNVQIGGVGYVDALSLQKGAVAKVEPTITRNDGTRTDITAAAGAASEYINAELFTMRIAPISSVALTDSAEVDVKVCDVIGEPILPTLTVTSSDPSRVEAVMNGSTIALTRKGEGKAIITVKGALVGYQDAMTSFGVYANGDAAAAMDKAVALATETTTRTVSLVVGNACNKSMKPGDAAAVAGVSAEDGAVISLVSSNPSVAAVSDFSAGGFTISAKAAGMTAITIRADKESTDGVTYLPAVQKILVLVSDPQTDRIQLTASLPDMGVISKTYDGSCAIALPEPVLTGIAHGDEVHAAAIAFFDTADAGNNKDLHIVYHLYGENAGEYLSPPEVVVHNAQILRRALTVEATAVEREYISGNRRVELTNVRTNGAVAGDRLSFALDDAHGELADDTAANSKAVKLFGITVCGAAVKNYNVKITDEVTVNILKQQVPVPVVGEAPTFNSSRLTADLAADDRYQISGNTGTAAGSYTATVTLLDPDNYRWQDGDSLPLSIDWSVSRRPIDISGTPFSSLVYTGSALQPSPALSDAETGVAMVKDQDYTLAYSNNINAGTAKVVVTGIGNYCGEQEESFTIAAKDIATVASIAPISPYTFTGAAIEPQPAVRDSVRNVGLVAGADFNYSYTSNTGAGTATVTITGTGNYTGTDSAPFTINAKTLSTSGISIADVASVTYSNQAITPTPAVTDTARNVRLESGTDFQYEYASNINAGSATIKIVGIGSYTGTLTKNFTIEKVMPTLAITSALSGNAGTTLALSATTGSTAAVSWSTDSATANTSLNGSSLKLGHVGAIVVRASVDETTNYYARSVTARITVRGVAPTISSVTGTPSNSFDSNARAQVSIASSVSNPSGSPVSVTYSVSRAGGTGSFVYTNGSSDTTARMAVGTYTLTAYARNVYGTSTKSTTVTVSPQAAVPSSSDSASGHNCSLTVVNSIPNGTVSGYNFQFTTASGHNGSDTWSVTAYYTGGGSAVILNGNASAGVTKSVSGLNLVNVSQIVFEYTVDPTHGDTCLGTNMSASISVAIPSNNDQDGTLENAAEIEAEQTKYILSDDVIGVEEISDMPYNDTAHTPTPAVTDVYRGSTLVAGEDFDYGYSNNTAAGTATVTITGKGRYSGTITRSFNILPAQVDALTGSVAAVDAVTFNGAAHTPTPAVTYSGFSESRVLVNGTDFDYSYSHNTSAGTATVAVVFKNNYAGTLTKEFTIHVINVTAESIRIAAIGPQTFTGEAILPTPAVTYTGSGGSIALIAGTDFEYSYSNNVEIGTGSITITFKGNYSGASTGTTFDIVDGVG